MTATLKINEELNGIELYFSSKPAQAILTTLKENKFRWSNFKKCWYAKQSEKALHIANTLTGEEVTEIQTAAVKTIKAAKTKETFNLWNATRWNDMKVSQDVKDQDTKAITKEIRSHLKKRFPGCKFSVTVPYYGKISAEVKSSPYEKDSVYLKEIVGYCDNLIKAYQHCYSAGDSYSDIPASLNFYFFNTSIDYDYTQTEATEEIKKDMLVFDSNLAAHEQAEEERKEAEYKEWEKQRELETIEFNKRQEEEKKREEFIYNSIETKELNENDQYFVVGSEFAHLNKNCTLDRYKEEVSKGEFSLEDVKITKEIYFSNEEALNNFSNMLLNDFDFLTGTGGSFSDDSRLNSMIDFDYMTEEERQSVKWNLYGIAIFFNNKLQFVVDTQGYNYARYVGLTDNATIEKTITEEQVISEEEIKELKLQADRLEDISVSVITDLNILDTWKNDNWTEYKTAMKQSLKQSKLKLTKQIIQQLEIEELKGCMYKLLNEVDGIQDQFQEADLKQGEKVTMFYISDWGSIVESRVTFNSVQNTKYAQYDNNVRVTFTPENKRKLHYNNFHSTLLVYKGWLNLPQTVLHNVEHKNGFIVTSSKYHSCDNRQYDEILEHFEQQGIKPVINTYKPTF